MAYDYFRADSESAMDFHNKYPDYEKFTPLPDNELVEEVNDLERLKISSGVDKQNVVERYQWSMQIKKNSKKNWVLNIHSITR